MYSNNEELTLLYCNIETILGGEFEKELSFYEYSSTNVVHSTFTETVTVERIISIRTLNFSHRPKD